MRALALGALAALAACTGPAPERTGPSAADRAPSVTTPGLHVSGEARVGVVRAY